MWKRIAGGARLGMICAGAFSLWVIGIYVLGGSAPFAHYHMTLLSTIAVYEIGGAASGAIVALMRPLLRWWLGATAVGIVAATPFGVGFRIAMDGWSPMSSDDWFVYVTFTVIVGLIGGYCLNKYQRDMRAMRDASNSPRPSRTTD